MDPATISALFLIFIATEKVVGYAGGKIADSFSKPIWEALEEKANALAGTDETSKRWRDFEKSFAEAKKKFLKEAKDPETAKILLDVLETLGDYIQENSDWLIPLSDELEKLSLVGEAPDVDALVNLCVAALEKKGVTPPKRADLADAARDFLILQRNCMFAKPAYRQLLKEQALWEKLQQRYDTRERYIAQVIKHYQDLDFVGIPELKDRQALRIEDVFISLQSQEESRVDARELAEKLGEVEVADVDKRNLLAHGELPKTTRRLSINQALAENLKIVVLGDPGSGKTTLLKYIALAFAENHPERLGLQEKRLPIFIRLYDYVAKRSECVGDGFSFVNYLEKFACDHLQLNLAPNFFAEVLECGDCCVCLDGLDELGAAGLRREVTAAVAALVNRYPRNRFIVTSRIVGYEEAPLDRKEFVHQTVQPLSDNDIKSFVEKWYQAREKDPLVRKERTEHLTKTIMEQERIKSLAANPLMLTIIALVHRIEAELPHERVKLYDKCVTTLVETWDKVRGMKYTLRRRLLEKLAYWMHTQPGENGRMREVREGNLELQLRNFLETDPKLQFDEDQVQREVAEFLTLAKTRSGLLVERGEGLYTFSHLTFQEFLAACDIEKRLAHSTDALWDEIRPHLHDPHWREVILLLLGLLNRYDYHNTDLVRRIHESSDLYEFALHRCLFLAARALADKVEISASLHNQLVNELLELALSNDVVSSDAFQFLGSLSRDSHLVSELFTMLHNNKLNVAVRNDAAKALVQLECIDGIADTLLDLVNNENVEHLEQYVSMEQYYASIMETLEKLGCVNEVKTLLLKFIKKPSGYSIASKDNYLGVRSSHALRLEQMGHGDENIFKELLAIANDKSLSDWIRNDAAQVLVSIGDVEDGRKLLEQLAKKSAIIDVRVSASWRIGLLGFVDNAIELMLLIAKDKGAAHSFIPLALAQFGSQDKNINALLTLASDKELSLGIRNDAIQTLIRLGYSDFVMDISQELVNNKKVSPAIRTDIAETLLKLGLTDVAMDIFLEVVHNDRAESQTKFSSAQALLQLGKGDIVVDVFLELAYDQKVDVWVRIDAAKALVELGQKDIGIDVLRQIARSKKKEIFIWYRTVSAKALIEFGQQDIGVDVLLKIVCDKKLSVWERKSAYNELNSILAEVK